jgi:hypothetical protein
MFVDLFEGTPVEEDVKRTVTRGAGEHDFRGDVDRWLARASSAS